MCSGLDIPSFDNAASASTPTPLLALVLLRDDLIRDLIVRRLWDDFARQQLAFIRVWPVLDDRGGVSVTDPRQRLQFRCRRAVNVN